MNRRIGTRLGLAAMVASCLHGAPVLAPTATLAIGDGATQPRVRADYAVVFAGPEGVVKNRSEPGVTLLFNRALRSLEDADDVARLPVIAVRTAGGAPVAGSWRWVGTRGLLFTPEQDLAGSTAFEVIVPKEVKSLEGDSLAVPYRLAFSTPRPGLLSTAPPEGAATLRADGAIRLAFNQRVAPEAFAKVGHLLVRATGAAQDSAVAFHSEHPRDGELRERTLVVKPDAPLPLDAAISLVIDKGLTAEGPLVSDAGAALHVRTYGPLALSHVRCPRVHSNPLGRCQAHRDVTVELSNAVMPDELLAHLKTPKLLRVPRRKPADGRALLPATSVQLGVDPQFGERYRITLTAGMADVYGQRLAKDVSFDVDIEAAFAKGAGAPSSGSGDGPDDAAEPPRFPTTQPSGASRVIPPFIAELGISGYVLEAAMPSGRKLSAELVNVPTFALLTANLQPREVAQFLLGTETQATGFMAGGYRFAWQSPNPGGNTRYVSALDLDTLLGASRRGVGLVALGVLGNSQPQEKKLVNVTDLAITAKMSRFGGIVWVTRLSTGKPVVGAEVSVGAMKAAALATFVTDARGVATLPKEALSAVHSSRSENGYSRVDDAGIVFAKSGDDWTFARVEDGQNFRRAAGYAVDLSASREWQGAVFADRGVYRPGETVKLAAVLRQADARGLTISEGREVRVHVTDEMGESLFKGGAKLNAFGSLAIDVPLPKGAHLGHATATLELPGLRGATFDLDLLLADFKAADFKVSVTADKAGYVRGDTAHFSVHGEYLFAAPMAGSAAHVQAVREVTSFTPNNADGFVTNDEIFTSDYGDRSARASSMTEDDATLDPAGNHQQTVDLAMPGQTAPERVAFESDVEDFTRQVVAGSASVIVHPAEFYVGARRPVSRFVAVGATVQPELITVSPDGVRVTGTQVHVELMHRNWTTVVSDSAGGTGSRRSKVEDVSVGSCDVVTSAASASCGLRVPSDGYFILRATATDRRKNTVRASYGFYALSGSADAGAGALGWAETDARDMKIESDKSTYQPGDTAKLLVRSPFKEASALVTVERGGVMNTQTVTLRGPLPVVEVPIADDYFPNVFVSVELVRGRVQPAPARGADLGRPDYRVGYAQLTVSPDSHRLKVDIKTPKKDYRPGEQLEADVLVRDASGAPMRADLTFYAVDEGVLLLTGYKTPDPLAAFTKNRSLAVFGMDSRDHLATLKVYAAGARLANLGYETPGDDKGGYGGGGGMNSGKRFDFRSTAFFEAGRITGSDGAAHFSFKLPDNLSSFRLMAVASTVDRFGSGEASVTSAKRLMVRPALPRALRVGDTFDASVVVSGKGLGGSSVEVEIASGSGAIAIAEPRTQRVTLGPSGSAKVHFSASAKGQGDAAVTFKVRGSGETDEVQLTRKVVLPLRLETAAAYGETSLAAAVALGDLTKLRGDTGSLEVHLASSALVGLQSAFEQLSDYPYGCTEQLASRILPLVALTDLAKSAGVRVPARGDGAMDAAVSELLTHQTDGGGFGYWTGDIAEPWLSAYAVLALDAAIKHGTFVPRQSLDRAVDYLRTALRDNSGPPTGNDDDDDDGSPVVPAAGASGDDLSKVRYAQAAFLADVLSTIGRADPGTLSTLFDARSHKSLSSQALLLHAMARAHMSKTELGTLAAELTARMRVDANAAFAEETDVLLAPMLDSPVRTSALSLRALLAVDPKQPLAARLAKGLLDARKSGAWGSTQENAWALLALDDYRTAQEQTPAAFDASVFLGGQSIGSAAFRNGSLHEERFTVSPEQARLLGGPLTFSVAGQGRLFYSAQLRGQIAEMPQKPVDRGLFVQKTMRAVTQSELQAALRVIPRATSLSAREGDLVIVDLIVESAEPREQVVIVDPIASGLEAIDFNLSTSGRSRSIGSDEAVTLAKGAEKALGMAFREVEFHREIRDDRVLTFVQHLAPGLYHFRYLARATVAGSFLVPPTSAECMYSPEVFGRTRATTYEIKR